MKQETLLGCGVVVLAIVVVGLVGWSQFRRNAESDDAGRMRRLYVALAEYSQSYDEVPAPSLPLARPFSEGISGFQSNRDPFLLATAGDYPADAGLPDDRERSPFRVSFAYLWCYPSEVRRHYASWSDANRNPILGLIADEWAGSVKPSAHFHADVGGPVLRIDVDGSLFRLPDRGGPKPLGNAEDLFFRH